MGGTNARSWSRPSSVRVRTRCTATRAARKHREGVVVRPGAPGRYILSTGLIYSYAFMFITALVVLIYEVTDPLCSIPYPCIPMQSMNINYNHTGVDSSAILPEL